MISNLLFPFVKIIYVYQRFICLKSHIYIFNTFTLYSYHQEKKRIMLRLKPPGHENAIIDNYVPIFRFCQNLVVGEEEVNCHVVVGGQSSTLTTATTYYLSCTTFGALFTSFILGQESSRFAEQKTLTYQKSFRAFHRVLYWLYSLYDLLLLNMLEAIQNFRNL